MPPRAACCGVVRDATGLVRALKRAITMSSSTSTKAVMAVMMMSRKSWNQVDIVHHRSGRLLQPNLPGRRLPEPAIAAFAPVRRTRPATANAVNRLEQQHRRQCSFE